MNRRQVAEQETRSLILEAARVGLGHSGLLDRVLTIVVRASSCSTSVWSWSHQRQPE
jgi:hypothetical protein